MKTLGNNIEKDFLLHQKDIAYLEAIDQPTEFESGDGVRVEDVSGPFTLFKESYEERI